MAKIYYNLLILAFTLNICLGQIESNFENNLRSLKSQTKKPSLAPLNNNTSTAYASSLKLHSKLLQTVYSDSFSKNYYYTTLYVGQNKIKQTYIIDTGSSILSSPCSPCKECGVHKRNYFHIEDKKSKPLKCDNKICKMVPATNCRYKKDKDENKKSCSFNVKASDGDGMKGYYLKDIVYFEADYHLSNRYPKKLFRSYALPIGCTTEEYGRFKDFNADGIMGVNYNDKSFISLLYKLKIINRDIFTLCFGLRGGYMSLGEIDTTYHKSDKINYVPLLTSDIYYLIKVNGILVGNSTYNNDTIESRSDAIIDTGNTLSYFPTYIYRPLFRQFNHFCKKQNGKCGEFKSDPDLGYCASFDSRESLFKAIYEYWPNITLKFSKGVEYTWKPIHYYYYYFKNGIRKACIGFGSNKSDNIILGTNFIHGHDIILDRQKKRFGFVSADCSRGNLLLKRIRGIINNETPKNNYSEIEKNSENKTFVSKNETDPHTIDKEIHKIENEGKFDLGDNTTKDMLEFIQGHNTELDFSNDFQLVNFIILLVSIIIVVVVFLVVISVLMCNKRSNLKYETSETNEYIADINEENDSGNFDEGNNENKISFEENK